MQGQINSVLKGLNMLFMARKFLKEKNQSFYGVCRVNQTQPHLIDEE